MFGTERYPPKIVKETPDEIHRFLAQYGVRYLELSMRLQRERKYRDSNIAWGKYRMVRIIEAALYPRNDDRGEYTFNYLIQKIDCQLDELVHVHDAL